MNHLLLQLNQTLIAAQESAAPVEAAAESSDFVAEQASFLTQALPLTILVFVGLAIPLGLMAASWFCHRQRDNNPTKGEAYECGLSETVGTADERFSVKFYLIAMLFLVFDLEVAFLYPWAVQFGAGGWGMVTVLIVFLIMLEAGYLYLYRKGALDWDD